MEIQWRLSARDDLRNARRYLAERNPQAAGRIFEAIRASVKRLADAPELGRPGRVDGTRELVVPGTQYLVAYAVLGNTLTILSVLHGAREWPGAF